MEFKRTDDARFDGLAGYQFTPHYLNVVADDGTQLRMHYLDEGPRDGAVILCLHGQPSWSFLYRKMIPLLVEAGYRVLAPDLLGFGRSDKPADVRDYSYAGHVNWLGQWLEGMNLNRVSLICQDWGGLIGLRVLSQHRDRFARLVVANTLLPGTEEISESVSRELGATYPNLPVPLVREVREAFAQGNPAAILLWRKYALESPEFSVRDVFDVLSNLHDPESLAGYAAPFPDLSYCAGARAFPGLIPLLPEHREERENNDRAWQVLEKFRSPVLTAFSDRDPITRGAEKKFQQRMAGAKGVEHVTIAGGGHFLQDDKGAELTEAVIRFFKAHPID